ncbi:MAG: hypothetical protein AB8G15_15515 [Saprospiraceae bacterium]
MQNNLKSIFGNNHGLDDRSIDFLTRALEKSNLPGFDYLEFKQSVAALAQMNIEEETAIKSAFTTAATMGLTKDKLLKTAGHYKEILAKEKIQFDTALQNQIQQKVAGKQAEVAKLKEQIVKHQEKIKQLQAQIEKSQLTIDGADEQINTEQSKLEETRDNFETTHQSILNQINKDIENIERYL